MAEPRHDFVFYDGSCGLCHHAVTFLVKRDVAGDRFRYAPLGGETFESRVPADVRASLPDSIVVVTAEGECLVRSRAAIHLLRRLGGAWRVAAALASVVPSFAADRVYDGVATIRRRIFAAPKGACPILPAHLRERFLP